jgi:hypothetical protein
MFLHDWGPSDGAKWMAADVEELDDPVGEGHGDWVGHGLGDGLGDASGPGGGRGGGRGDGDGLGSASGSGVMEILSSGAEDSALPTAGRGHGVSRRAERLRVSFFLGLNCNFHGLEYKRVNSNFILTRVQLAKPALVLATIWFEPVRDPRVTCHDAPRAQQRRAIYSSPESDDSEELSSPEPVPEPAPPAPPPERAPRDPRPELPRPLKPWPSPAPSSLPSLSPIVSPISPMPASAAEADCASQRASCSSNRASSACK